MYLKVRQNGLFAVDRTWFHDQVIRKEDGTVGLFHRTRYEEGISVIEDYQHRELIRRASRKFRRR